MQNIQDKLRDKTNYFLPISSSVLKKRVIIIYF